MKEHIRIYMDHFNLGEQDYVFSEISGKRCTQVHHIEGRKRGGSKDKDYIENLIGLTMEEHVLCESNPRVNEYVKQLHLEYLECNPYNRPDINWEKTWKVINEEINELI
jgi:hypothetical protein